MLGRQDCKALAVSAYIMGCFYGDAIDAGHEWQTSQFTRIVDTDLRKCAELQEYTLITVMSRLFWKGTEWRGRDMWPWALYIIKSELEKEGLDGLERFDT